MRSDVPPTPADNPFPSTLSITFTYLFQGDTKYMAPELLNSLDRYPSADIFSLGLTLYEVCIAAEHRDLVRSLICP